MDDGEDSVIVVHALLAWVGLISEVNVNTTVTVKEDTPRRKWRSGAGFWRSCAA